MDKNNLKFVKGCVSQGMAADICFYTDVNYWNVQDFLYEFNYLVSFQPSEIRIHINSTGGNVSEGISVFTKIIDCPIHTVCINDGLAASIASVIWAAGKELKMRDYALLMIHNPFIENGNETENEKQIIEAFTKQLVTIYKTRFNMSDEKIKAIMDGAENVDGTFFTAEEAVANGFLPSEGIIETPSALHEKVAASLNGIADLSKITAIMALALDEKKPKTPKDTIIEKESKNSYNQLNNEQMNKEWTVIAALLGMSSEKASEDSVTLEIKGLKAKVAKFEEVNAELSEAKKSLATAQTELSGAKATISNLQKDFDEAKASLQKYQEAEEAARQAAIVAMVDDAINSCKINKETREDWLKMANNDLETTKRVLDSIPAREKISQKIAEDKSNMAKAQDDMKSVEDEVKEKVEAVVGKDFKFRTIE